MAYRLYEKLDFGICDLKVLSSVICTQMVDQNRYKDIKYWLVQEIVMSAYVLVALA